MDDLYSLIDFSGILDFPHDISKYVIDNIPDFYDQDDASTHIKSFIKFIEEWCDPSIYEDVLIQFFVLTLCGDWANDWFHDSPNKRFKNIRDLLHAFLEIFGHDRDEVYNELVDDFVEKWKRKNLLAIETTSSDIKIDAPLSSIEELKEIIMNMQYSHTKQLEAMQLAHARQVEAMNE